MVILFNVSEGREEVSGTLAGAKKSVDTIREKYGSEYYHELGVESIKKAKLKYGDDAHKKWGAEGVKHVKNPVYPFRDDRTFASIAGTKGGMKGARYRTINPGDSMRLDEWAQLIKFINRAAGVIRLETEEEDINGIDQHVIRFNAIEYMEKDDWVGAMKNSCDHPRFLTTLGEVIEKEYQTLGEYVKGEPRNSPNRNQLRIIRNIRGAYKTLGVKKYNESKSNSREL